MLEFRRSVKMSRESENSSPLNRNDLHDRATDPIMTSLSVPVVTNPRTSPNSNYQDLHAEAARGY